VLCPQSGKKKEVNAIFGVPPKNLQEFIPCVWRPLEFVTGSLKMANANVAGFIVSRLHTAGLEKRATIARGPDQLT